MTGRALNALTLIGALATGRVAAQQATFQGLGVLAGQTTSTARGLSPDGGAVIGICGPVGYVWTASGGMVDLGYLPGTNVNTPVAIAAGAARIVGTSSGRGYSWTAGGGIQDLGGLPGTTTNTPVAISGDGNVVIGSCAGNRGYYWTAAGGYLEVPSPDDRTSSLKALSYDGSTALGAFGVVRSPYAVFRYRPGQIEMLPSLPGGMLGGAVGVLSADGQVAAGRSFSATTGPPVIWDAAGAISIPTGAAESPAMPLAISADGSVIVGNVSGFDSFVIRNGQFEALSFGSSLQLFALSADGQILLGTARVTATTSEPVIRVNNQTLWLKNELTAHGADLTGWTLSNVVFISRDGATFCGTGTLNGVTQAWRAVLPRN